MHPILRLLYVSIEILSYWNWLVGDIVHALGGSRIVHIVIVIVIDYLVVGPSSVITYSEYHDLPEKLDLLYITSTW